MNKSINALALIDGIINHRFVRWVHFIFVNLHKWRKVKDLFSGNYFRELVTLDACKSARDRITSLFGDNGDEIGQEGVGEQAENRFELLRQRKYDDDTGIGGE